MTAPLPRLTPQEARRRRRRDAGAATMGVVMALVAIGDGLGGMRTGRLVANRVGGVGWPGLLVVAVGLAVLIPSVWILWRALRPPRGD